jgi:hypothetical protein
VGAVENTGQWEKVYNFRVADHHTYFVGTEDWGFSVWAHNQSCENPKAIRDAVDTAVKDPKAAKNVATVAQRKIQDGKSDQAVIDYLTSKGVDPTVAKNAVANSKIAPSRSSMVPEGVEPRDYYLGRTPRVNEGPGKAVLARMMQEREAVQDAKTGEIMIRSTDPITGQSGWYKLSESTMGHKQDAVHWWNETGRFYVRPNGQVAREVRAWMTDPNNYVIEYKTHNYAKGAMTKNAGYRYADPPVRSLPVLE